MSTNREEVVVKTKWDIFVEYITVNPKKRNWGVVGIVGVIIILFMGLLFYNVAAEQNQISDLKQQIQNSQKTISDLQKKHSGDVKVIQDLKKSNGDLNNQNNSLKQTNDGLNKQNQDLNKQNANLKQQVSLANQQNQVSPRPSSSSGVTLTMNVSAYQAGCPGCSGITATGTHPSVGRTIAVDPNIIPLGTKVHMHFPSAPQYDGDYIAEDTGGAIHGHKIDLYLGSVSVCMSFGVRNAEVTIYN
jgi:3D (Asp-Asp-Asp) domain-containing protein